MRWSLHHSEDQTMDTTMSIVHRILAHRKTDYKRMLASNDASIKILSRVVLINNVCTVHMFTAFLLPLVCRSVGEEIQFHM